MATPLGTVVDLERGSLPYALVHGESLVARAAWELGEAGVTPVDFDTPWHAIRTAATPFVLHDSLCPLTPADFIAACLGRATDTGAAVVGVRLVTDTVKVVDADQRVGQTLDRDEFLAVCSPIALPTPVVAALGDPPPYDFAEAVAALATRFPVSYLPAPPQARRVSSEDDLRLLEALTARTPTSPPGRHPRGR